MHNHHDIAGEAMAAATKAAPPVTVAASAIAGLPLERWVLIATLIYTILMIAHVTWRWARELRGKGGDRG